MSLHQILNSGNSGAEKPQTPVIHVLTRKKEISPKPTPQRQVVPNFLIQQAPPQPPPSINQFPPQQNIAQIPKNNQVAETHYINRQSSDQTQTNDNILIFTLMSKLLLPKDRLEKINLLFQKLLLGKLSFGTVSKHISTHLEICPVLLKVWQSILNRNVTINNPLYHKLNEIVAYFRTNDLSNYVLVGYISAISSSKQYSNPLLFIFEHLISNFDVFNRLNKSSKLLQFSLDLLRLLPKPIHPLRSTLEKPHSSPSFTEVLISPYREKPFSVYPHYSDISTFMMRNSKIKEHTTHRHVSARDTTYTPSHHQHLIPILDEQPCFFLNYLTKSLHSGHEGGSRGHENRHTEIPLPITRDIHDVMEQPEIREHEFDAILSFGPETNFIGHIANVAGKTVYDDQTWEKIIKYLKSFKVRKYVCDQCRQRLLPVESAHRDACALCDIFLSTRPINIFLNQLKIRPDVDGMTFLYYNTSLEVSEYSKSVFNLYTSPRYHYVPFFFRNFFSFLAGENMRMLIIFPKSGVMALYYYSLLCEALTPLLSRKASSFATFEAAFDIACEEVQERFPDGESALPHRFLSKVLKSITKNGTIVDEMSYEIHKHFGVQSIYVARIAPILSHFNAACHSLSVEPHWNEMKKLAELFGSALDQKTLDSRFLLYSERMKFDSCEQMFVMRYSPTDNVIRVSQNI